MRTATLWKALESDDNDGVCVHTCFLVSAKRYRFFPCSPLLQYLYFVSRIERKLNVMQITSKRSSNQLRNHNTLKGSFRLMWIIQDAAGLRLQNSRPYSKTLCRKGTNEESQTTRFSS
jgi:hypothetical protein